MYSGNSIQQSDDVIDDKKKPRLNLSQAINQLVDRVFSDVYLTVGVPDAGLGEVNDLAVNTSTWIPYTKTGSGWVAGTAIDNDANAFLLISSKR